MNWNEIPVETCKDADYERNEMDKEYYRQLAERLECSSCRYCDQEAVYTRPCCLYPEWPDLEEEEIEGIDVPVRCNTKLKLVGDDERSSKNRSYDTSD